MSRVYVCTNEVNRNFYFFLFVVPTRPRSLYRPPYGPNAHPTYPPPPTSFFYFVSSERCYSFLFCSLCQNQSKAQCILLLTVCTVIAAFKNQISTCFLAMNRRRADCKCMHTITYYCTTTTTTLFSEIPSVIDPFYCCSSTSLDTIVIQRRGRRYVLFTEMSTFLRPQQLD